MREGKKDKAKAALDYAEKVIPAYNVPLQVALNLKPFNIILKT